VLVPENLQSQGELAFESDVILVVAEEPLTRGALQQAMGWMVNTASRGDLEEFRQRVLESGVVQDALLDQHLMAEGGLEDTEVRDYARDLEETLLARKMLMEPARALMAPVTDDDVLEHWRAQEASLGRFHGRVRYDEVGLPSTVEDIVGWQAKLERVTSSEEFGRVSREVAVGVPSAILINGLQGHVSMLPPEVSRLIASGGIPGLVITTPEDGEPLVALWITEGIADRQPTEPEREQSRREVEQMRLQDAIVQVLVDLSQQVEMEVLVPRTY
jgi:hypothetical protein